MKSRTKILIISLVVGILALALAVLFAVAGAGMYGTPFDGDTYFNITLFLVLLCGPVAILPCVLLDFAKPGLGGLLLCGLALVDVGMLVAHNLREWGFAIHSASLGTLSIPFPIFLIGSFLYFAGRPEPGWGKWVWRVEFILAMLVAGFFVWHTGSDGLQSLIHVLRGGTL